MQALLIFIEEMLELSRKLLNSQERAMGVFQIWQAQKIL